MISRIAEALQLKYAPVALLWSDAKPADAIEFAQGKWGCVMTMFAQTAVHGKTAAFDRETYGCLGGGVGLGFGNCYVNYWGGEENFARFLSTGNEGTPDYEQTVEQIKSEGRSRAVENFLHGERYLKSPEIAQKFLAELPMREVPTKYVLFKPLAQVDETKEQPVVIVFLPNPDQLSALVVLANYGRDTADNVAIPFAAGCQNIGIRAYHEAESRPQRAIVGLTDLSARAYLAKTIGHEYMTFAVPFAMYREMESNVPESFLERETWESLKASN